MHRAIFLYKLAIAVGEYVSDLNFLGLLATETSIRTSRVLATTVSGRVVYAEISKNEDTWYGMLGHYDAEYDTALRAQQFFFAGIQR